MNPNQDPMEPVREAQQKLQKLKSDARQRDIKKGNAATEHLYFLNGFC